MSTERRRRADRAELYQSPRFAEAAMRVAVNVRTLRLARGWTQETAAESCSVDIRVWQGIESGTANTTLVTLARLAEGLDVEISAFFTRVDGPLLKRRGRPRKTTEST